MRSSSLRLATLLFGVLPVLVASAACSAAIADDGQAPVEKDCGDVRRVLDDLAGGSIAEVWSVVEAGDLPDFDAIADADDERYAPCRDMLVERLLRVISRSDDDRIVARLVGEIDSKALPGLLSVVQAALRHPSPDVHRRMLRAVTAAAAPTLGPEVEARFEVERDERTRRELIRALAATGSRRYLAELRDLARSDDAPLRHAAMHAVLDLPDAASVPVLAELASSPPDGDLEQAARIVRTFASWDDAPGVDEALVRIGREAPDQVAEAAILELEKRGVDAVGALVAIANARRRGGDAILAEQAQAAAGRLGGEVGGLYSVTTSCGLSGSGSVARALPLASMDGDEFSDAPVMIVSPADGSDTARCWDAPGFMWPGEIRPRVPAGQELRVFDEFSWGGETWLAGISVEDICWVRENDLVPDAEERAEPDGVAAYEFDLPFEELDSWAVGTLEHRGWLTMLSADETVAAFHLEIDEPTRDDVAALIEVRHRTMAPGLAAAIDRWLYRHGSSWSHDDDLGGAIPTRDPRWADESEDEEEADEGSDHTDVDPG
jgi:hypothetical protein